MKWWKRKRRESERLTVPSASDFMQLLTALTQSSIERFKAQIESDARIDEINLKRRELDLNHAEEIAKAAAVERESKAELKQKQKAWAASQGNLVGKNKPRVACREIGRASCRERV